MLCKARQDWGLATKIGGDFDHACSGLYPRVHPDQSTDRQRRELRNYAKACGWKIVREMQETVSGASQKRPLREEVCNWRAPVPSM
jgi:Resolvase, N terminal domain